MADKYRDFMDHVRLCAEKFRLSDNSKPIRLVSHIDADGISSCSIMVKTLNIQNRKYSISTIQNLTRDAIEDLSKEPCQIIIFTDIGSGQIRAINELLAGKEVIILDHHLTEDIKLAKNISHINPNLFGYDGGSEISGAGVTYLFCRELEPRIRGMAHIAVVGALGDVQRFNSLNQEILNDAIAEGNLKIIKGLRIFGAQTRPLHKVLEYSTDPYIPGVTGSESGSIQFLQQLGINPKSGSSWKKIVHLVPDEIKKLVSGIIMKRFGEKKPEDVLGDVYLLPKEESESPFRDAREFATLLNATGRMGKASLGIGSCLGDKKNKELAVRNLIAYKKEIINALEWFEKNRGTNNVIKGEGYAIINAGNNVKHTIVGTLASIISKSNKMDADYLLSIARMEDGFSKASLRYAKRDECDLQSIMKEITSGLEGCESGGHMQAAGAVILSSLEHIFIKRAQEILRKKGMEEVIT